MTLSTAFVVVGAIWAAVALLGVVLWSRLKVVELATTLAGLQLEHGGPDDGPGIPEVER